MLPVVVWLSALLTAGLSDQDRRRRQEALMRTLRQRLYQVDTEPGWKTKHPAVRGGVTIWQWADGDRIVRLVTDAELDDAMGYTNPGVDIESEEDLTEAFAPDDEEEPFDDDVAVFVYLDEFNRPHVFLSTHRGVPWDLFGRGEYGQIEGREVRSRVFQFLVDNEMMKEVTHEEGNHLWYDDVLIEEGFGEILRVVEHGLAAEPYSDWDAWLDSLEHRFGRSTRNYAVVYADLDQAWCSWRATGEQLYAVLRMDFRDEAFLDMMIESDWIWRLEDEDIEQDLLERAYRQDDDEAWEELSDKGFSPERIRDIQLELLQDERNEHGRDLWKAIESEADEASNMFGTQNTGTLHELRSQSTRNGLEWDLYPSNIPYADPIVSIEVYHSGDDVVWEIGGHRYTETPGILPNLTKGMWTETEAELYDKAPGEVVWAWPGDLSIVPEYEGQWMLGNEEMFDPVRSDLRDFLIQAYRLKRLTPDQIGYWDAFLRQVQQ